MIGDQLARAAQQLVGAPFRLHGRDPRSGLDCIGLFGAAMALCGRPVGLPAGYPLRMRDCLAWLPDLASCGLAPGDRPVCPGDVLLIEPGRCQVHLIIAGPQRSWIHAHAGLRRVVEQQARPAGKLLHHWRPFETS